MASYIVLHCVFLPFGKNLPSTSYHVHRLPKEWVISPQPWGSTESSHYHSPALFYMGFFFLYILAAVLVVEYTLMDHLYFCIYLFITRPQPQPSPLPLSACRMYCM